MPPPSFDCSEFSKEHLYEALSNELFTATEVAAHERASYLYGYLKDINAKIIIVEYDYTDRDYLDDFAAYYVRCFAPYKRRCKRLHFFSKPLAKDAFLQLIRGSMQNDEYEGVAKAYLGFIVARPLPDAIIGRTLLVTYPRDNGRRNYTCTRKNHANLFGVDLAVESLAFQEQDTVLAACATVALWCCFQKTGDLFDTPIPTPAAITRVANQVIHHARPIPSHGLNVQQICNAINHVGLEPEVIHVNEDVPLVSLIYGYLKMGLPIILGVSIEGRGRHAIALTGYSLQKTTALKQEVAGSKTCIPMIGLRINEFYAHDDQIGPFSRLHVNPTALHEKKAYPVTFESAWHDYSTGKNLRFYPDVVIVPVYGKIRVTFIDIQKWLTRLTEVLYLVFPPGAPLEWDIYLTTTNDYKRFIKSSGIATVREDVLENLLLKQHPRFIWRSTLRHNGNEILELLADATDMSRSLPIYQVLWHNDKVKNSFYQRLEALSLRELFMEILTQRFWTLLHDSTKPAG